MNPQVLVGNSSQGQQSRVRIPREEDPTMTG